MPADETAVAPPSSVVAIIGWRGFLPLIYSFQTAILHEKTQ